MGGYHLSVDFDVLKQELSGCLIDDGQERYQFTWPDKRKSVVLANSAISATLRPVKEDETTPSGEDASGKPYISSGSVDFDSTQNLYIEGDNLKVLKLLRETYLGKVKMIYIDPPYNTGNDFVYEDDFTIKSDEWGEKSGDYDEEGNRLVKNVESNGRFHTDWLNMLYPRLRLARDLLTDDGAIFISIGDDEEGNLLKICDEIFGKQNFIANICHKSRASVSNDRIISENHNHLLFYAKNEPILFARKNEIGDDPDLTGFTLHDEKGDYKLTPVDGPGGAKKGNPYYEFLGVEGYWRYSKETMQKRYNEGLIVRTPNGLQQKYYKFQAEKSRKTVTTWWDEGFLTSSATSKLVKLMGAKTFDNPKSVNLVLRAIKLIAKADKNSIILDFFSGSATTAHAVMQLNAEDGGKRKFIMVQLPEKCDEQSEAFKSGYKNICEIGKERIRRAGRKILELSLEGLEKEGVIEKYAGKLSEIRSLEEVYGAGGTSLSADKPVAKRGNVCLSRSNATGSGFNSVEHSRRTGSGDTGIYPIFESGEGLTSGAGNTIVTMRSLKILNMLGYRVCVECIRGDQQNDIFSDYTSKLQALNSKLSLDTGFRVLKLDSSNMQDVYYNPQKISQTLLDATIDNVKPDRSPLDLLFQVMLELGVPLSAKIEEHAINGKTYFAVNGNDVIACFDDNIDNDVITAIAKQQPLYAVFKDKSFASDSVAINNEQLFKTYSPTTIIKVM